jgi:hypothetical protein
MTFFNGASLTQIAESNCKRKIVSIEESSPFDFKNGLTQCSGIIRMDEQNMIVSLDHLHSFLIGRISGVTPYTFLKKIFTAPSTFQNRPNIKIDFLG